MDACNYDMAFLGWAGLGIGFGRREFVGACRHFSSSHSQWLEGRDRGQGTGDRMQIQIITGNRGSWQGSVAGLHAAPVGPPSYSYAVVQLLPDPGSLASRDPVFPTNKQSSSGFTISSVSWEVHCCGVSPGTSE